MMKGLLLLQTFLAMMDSTHGTAKDDETKLPAPFPSDKNRHNRSSVISQLENQIDAPRHLRRMASETTLSEESDIECGICLEIVDEMTSCKDKGIFTCADGNHDHSKQFHLHCVHDQINSQTHGRTPCPLCRVEYNPFTVNNIRCRQRAILPLLLSILSILALFVRSVIKSCKHMHGSTL